MKAEEFKIGDRVARKKYFSYQCNSGTIEKIDQYGRCYILWDKKSGKATPGYTSFNPDIGQQHSTINQRFLKHI